MVTLCVAAPAALLYLVNPSAFGLFPPCPFHALTGLHCPGCGTLRGLHQLLHGNIGAAMGLNPLMVISIPFLGYAYVSYGLSSFGMKPLEFVPVPAWWGWFVLCVVVSYGILRNIPTHPFSLLAP